MPIYCSLVSTAHRISHQRVYMRQKTRRLYMYVNRERERALTHWRGKVRERERERERTLCETFSISTLTIHLQAFLPGSLSNCFRNILEEKNGLIRRTEESVCSHRPTTSPKSVKISHADGTSLLNCTHFSFLYRLIPNRRELIYQYKHLCHRTRLQKSWPRPPC